MRSPRLPTQTFDHAKKSDAADGADSAEVASDRVPELVDDFPTAVRLYEVPSRESASPSGGAVAPRYGVRQRIGVGGMGTIDLVHDRVVGRDVALKQMISPATDDRAEWAAFEREARLQGQLEHPSIVPVYDVGTAADGSPYFTMKRVRGESLASILDRVAAGDAEARQRFSRRKLLTAFAQLCLAAHYAHERGVVHRDIKPANLMLGGYGEVYLLDWGIATVRGDAMSAAGSLGTIAPEQAQGLAVDARADVYSLGAVLFEILTLEPLHAKQDSETMLAEIVMGVEARPSIRAPDADVPPELEAACVAATRREPADRTPSALVLHASIEAYLDGDRDLALRRETAKKYAESAKAIAEEHAIETSSRAPAAEAEQRARALGEIGKALALDPTNADALRTLVRLLTHPPRHVPREVREGQTAATRRNLRRGGIAGAALYAYISLNALTTWLMGVHDWTVFWIAHALWAGAMIASIVTIVRPTHAALAVTFAFGASASLWITNVYGPYLMVPSFLTMHAFLFALVGSWRLRTALLIITCLAWTASVFGEMHGLFDDTVRFVDGGVLIHSKVIDLPEGLTSVYLYAAVLAMILLPSIVIGMLRSSYERADQKMRLQRWQLQRLVPDGAARTIEGSLG